MSLKTVYEKLVAKVKNNNSSRFVLKLNIMAINQTYERYLLM